MASEQSSSGNFAAEVKRGISSLRLLFYDDMKRIILLMLAIASMTAGNSQTNNDAKKLVSNSWFWFKEYKHHFINMKDSTDFVVVPMEGYTKKDLFQKMMLGLNDVYNDINKVVSTVGEDAITVNAYHEIKKSPFKIGGEFYYITGFQCRFSFKFKDGRLRVEAPQVSTFDYHHFLNENSTSAFVRNRVRLLTILLCNISVK